MAALDFPYLNQFFLSRLENQQRQQDPAYKMNMRIQEDNLQRMLEQDTRRIEFVKNLQGHPTSQLPPEAQKVFSSMIPFSPETAWDYYSKELGKAQEKREWKERGFPALEKYGGIDLPDDTNRDTALFLLQEKFKRDADIRELASHERRTGVSAGATIRSTEIGAEGAVKTAENINKDKFIDNVRQAVNALGATRNKLIDDLREAQHMALLMLDEYGANVDFPGYGDPYTGLAIYRMIKDGKIQDVPENIQRAVNLLDQEPVKYAEEQMAGMVELQKNIVFNVEMARRAGVGGPELESILGKSTLRGVVPPGDKNWWNTEPNVRVVPPGDKDWWN